MKKEVVQPKPAYVKPSIQTLGNFAELTLGGKSSGLGDMSHGIHFHIGS